jgi:hypothetical protein
MIHSHIAPLPTHRYVWIEPNALGNHDWMKAIWFGLVSHPSRAWGCNVLLKCGAMYRNVPLNKLSTGPSVNVEWTPAQAQVWDCYGYDFAITEYTFLSEMRVRARFPEKTETMGGSYLFSVSPVADGWSRQPEQSKEFTFVELDNGRFCALPTNGILFDDRSFVDLEWPTFLRRQVEVCSAEE